jgi:hypothetical protein
MKRLKLQYFFALIFIAGCSISFSACKKEQVASEVLLAKTTEDANTQPSQALAVTPPSQILNLTNWKITLPIDNNGDGNADEVKQPDLDDYSISPYFRVTYTGTGVSFRANAGGATTSGSGYPRSELREMKNNGTATANWASGSGTHTLEVEMSIKNLPVKKPEMIVSQIHDNTSDLLAFKISGTKLFLDNDDVNRATLNSNYSFGTKFTIKFVVSGNKTKCYYNGTLKYTLNKSYSGYFKTGAYVLSSCKGSKKVSGELCDAFGEVVIYNINLQHS